MRFLLIIATNDDSDADYCRQYSALVTTTIAAAAAAAAQQ